MTGSLPATVTSNWGGAKVNEDRNGDLSPSGSNMVASGLDFCAPGIWVSSMSLADSSLNWGWRNVSTTFVPMRISSPSVSMRSPVIFSPLRIVPLTLPRSSIKYRSSRQFRRAWRRETSESLITSPAGSMRPIISSPSFSSMTCPVLGPLFMVRVACDGAFAMSLLLSLFGKKRTCASHRVQDSLGCSRPHRNSSLQQNSRKVH